MRLHQAQFVDVPAPPREGIEDLEPAHCGEAAVDPGQGEMADEAGAVGLHPGPARRGPAARRQRRQGILGRGSQAQDACAGRVGERDATGQFDVERARLIGLVAAVVALIVLGVAIAVAFFLMSPGADFDDPSTPAPSSTGSDWQPSGG